MKRLRNPLPRSTTRSPIRNQRPLRFEQLEARALLAAVAAPSELISWWSANGSGSDVMGANNATLFNGATYAAGMVGQAFSFDGEIDRLQVADSNSLKLTASLTIECWIKVKAFPTSGRGYIFARGDDSGSPYVLNTGADGTLQFSINPLITGGSTISIPLLLGQFTHVAATLDDATGLMSLYVNGVLAAQSTTDVRPYGDLQPASNPGIGIGNTAGYPGTTTNSPFSGLIDELSVYNRALTPGEVLGIFKAGNDGKVLSPIAVNGPSVIEGSSGTTSNMAFTIQRSGNLSGSLSVAYATADDSAIAGSDYVAASGTVTFAVGEATKTVQVTVNGDNTGEANETFRLIVTPAGGTAIMGVATILNDDSAISISSTSATEGDNTIRYFDDFVPTQSRLTPRLFAFGADGNLYVTGRFTNDVQKYDGNTGAFLTTVIPSGSHGLWAPWSLVFGPDGNLYVGGTMSNNVLRYNVTTGVIDEFLPSSSGVVSPGGLRFDSTGNLLVSTGANASIQRFQGPNGVSPGSPFPALGQTGAVFVPPGSGGLTNANGLNFGPDGNLYVIISGLNTVNRYNGTTGAFIDTFVSAGSGGLNGPQDLAFRPDGFLYVSSQITRAVYRYNAITGAFVSTAVPSGGGNNGLGWDSNGNLYTERINNNNNMQQSIVRYGTASQEAFTVTLDYASAMPVAVSYSTADGTAIAGSDYTAVASGSVYFAPGETSKTFLIQTVDNLTYESTETFFVNLSNPIGATIAVGQGVGTILDNDPPASNAPYYKGSFYTAGGTNIEGGFDPSKHVAKAGTVAQTLSFQNVSNYTRGINGLVIDVPGLTATSLTIADLAFRMSPQGAFDETANPPSSWVAAPAPTAIVVTPSTATTPARVRFEWPDNAIQNRWLEVRVLANAAFGVPTTQEFYLGNLQGEINGSLLGGIYFVQNADLTAALPVGGVGSVSSIRDVDKNGFILNSDFIAIRLGIIGGLVLRNITIPAAGSGAALPRFSSSGIGAPPMLPFEQTSTWVMPSSSGTIRLSNESHLGNIASLNSSSGSLLGCIADSTNGTKATSKPSKVVDISDEGEIAVGRNQIVDDFFTDWDRQFRRKK